MGVCECVLVAVHCTTAEVFLGGHGVAELPLQIRGWTTVGLHRHKVGGCGSGGEEGKGFMVACTTALVLPALPVCTCCCPLHYCGSLPGGSRRRRVALADPQVDYCRVEWAHSGSVICLLYWPIGGSIRWRCSVAWGCSGRRWRLRITQYDLIPWETISVTPRRSGV